MRKNTIVEQTTYINVLVFEVYKTRIRLTIGKRGSGPGGSSDPPVTSSKYNFTSITRACNVFKECGPMITSNILRKLLQFNTLLIYIPTSQYRDEQ